MRVRPRGDDPRLQEGRVRERRGLRGEEEVRAHEVEGQDVPRRLHHVQVRQGMGWFINRILSYTY